MHFYVGQIAFFSFSRPFQGWLPCDGRSIKIADYPALASLIGTRYGGDGRTAVNLPDLRGRFPLIANGAPALPGRINAGLASSGGETSLTIAAADLATRPAAVPDRGAEQVRAVVPAPLATALPPPPYLAIMAFICFDGVYPEFID